MLKGNRITKIVSVICIIAALLCGTYSVAAAAFRYISFENASVDSSTYNLTEGANTYPFIRKGDFRAPVLTSSQKYRGSYGIAYQMDPTSGTAADGNTTDKSQHRIISGNDQNPLTFGQKKYWGFAVKLDSTMEDPDSTTQIFQWWQGAPMSPPLELRLIHSGSDTTFKYELVYRNNTTTANPSACKPIYQGTITKGTWNTFVIMTILRNTNDSQDGEVKLWQNGTQLCDWLGRVGYGDGIVYAGTSYTPNTNFDVFFGPYRPRQMKNLKMYFDQVRYTDTYSEANPDN